MLRRNRASLSVRLDDQTTARDNVVPARARRPGHNIAAAILSDVPHSDDSPYDDGTLYAHG